MSSGGLAIVSSNAACSPCPGTAAGQTSGSGAALNAASGNSQAQGLMAQNLVSTDASVAVSIGGDNHGAISVVVESITQIANYGVALATSGLAKAAGRSAGVPAVATQSDGKDAAAGVATSGNADAVGARVNNAVEVGTTAAVKVDGDNYSPISIVIESIASLMSFGGAQATTGDVRAGATGAGDSAKGAIGASGQASALGLKVQNLVNLWTQVVVDIKGSNYAPITVVVRFITAIDNEGQAVSASGNTVAAGAADATAPVDPAPDAAAQTTVSGGRTTAAETGDALAVGNVHQMGLTSSQVASANDGSASVTADASRLASAAANVLGAARSILGTQPTPSALTLGAAPPTGAEEGTIARTGGATAGGMLSNVVVVNNQVGACVNPNGACTANNVADVGTQSYGVGDASTGFAGANATPTPVPPPPTQAPWIPQDEVAATPTSVPTKTTIAASPTAERPAQAVVPPTAAPVNSVPTVTVPKVEPTAVVVAPTPVLVVPAPESSPVVVEPQPQSQPQQGGVWTGGGPPATGVTWVSVPLRPVATPTATSPEGYRTDAPLTAGWPDAGLPPMPGQMRLPPMPVVYGGGPGVVQPTARLPWGEVIDIELSMDWPERVLPPMPLQVVPDLIVAPQAQEEAAEVDQLPQVPAIDIDDVGSSESGWPEVPVLWFLSLAFAVAAAATQRRGRLVLTWIGRKSLAMLLFILGLN